MDSVTETKTLETPFLVGMGGFPQRNGTASPAALSAMPAAAGDAAGGWQAHRCLAKLSLFQQALSKHVTGVPGHREVGVGAQWTLLQRSVSIQDR